MQSAPLLLSTLVSCLGFLVFGCTSDPPELADGSGEAVAADGSGASSGGSSTITLGGGATGPGPGAGGAGGLTTGGGAATAGAKHSGGVTSNGGVTGSGGADSSGGTSSTAGTNPAGGNGSGTGGQAHPSGGETGTGGLWRGPTPASETSRFPFPQNRESAHCTYPTTYRNEDVQAVYEQWKQHLVTSEGAGGYRRVQRVAEPGLAPNSTVSEGIAYGMMIAVYMDDQQLFDDLWKYALLHTWTYTDQFGGNSRETLLMNWYILSDGNLGGEPSGSGAATDADEDIAWALVMADRQWGGQGSHSRGYIDYARELIENIWEFEIHDGKLIKNGSNWGSWDSLNISYFAPAYYRVFAEVSGNAAWNTDVVDTVYDVIAKNLHSANGNQDNGLVPAFSTSEGGPAAVSPGQNPLAYHYQYDSCRTPFRIGLDACLFAEPRAVDYVTKTSQFFGQIGAANIVDGYELNGTPNPEFPSAYDGLSAAFIGPAGVGAMHNSEHQSFIDDVYGLIRQNNMWCGGQYYDESWTMLSMLMLTGNFLDYTQY